MEILDKRAKEAQTSKTEEKGLSYFLASLPKEEIAPKPFFVRIKENMRELFIALWQYFRSPEFFIWVRNWLKTNLFYLFPASLAAPLMAYCFVGADAPRLKLLEYGTLDTLWRANLISLSIVLLLGWFHRLLMGKKVEVQKTRHPFFRLFWYWLGANFIYILPILLYGSIKNAWYFVDGMERFLWVTVLVIELWSVATFFSLLIMSVTGASEWVFWSLSHSDSDEEHEESAALEEIKVLNGEKEVVAVERIVSVEEVMVDKKSDDDKANNA